MLFFSRIRAEKEADEPRGGDYSDPIRKSFAADAKGRFEATAGEKRGRRRGGGSGLARQRRQKQRLSAEGFPYSMPGEEGRGQYSIGMGGDFASRSYIYAYGTRTHVDNTWKCFLPKYHHLRGAEQNYHWPFDAFGC